MSGCRDLGVTLSGSGLPFRLRPTVDGFLLVQQGRLGHEPPRAGKRSASSRSSPLLLGIQNLLEGFLVNIYEGLGFRVHAGGSRVRV